MNKHFQRVCAYVLTGLMIVVMSWEYQRVTASSLVMTTEIPEESLRLRILANSDSPHDQWLKEEVRNEVVELITTWVNGMDDIDDAREVIAGSLAELERVVGQTIQSRGFNYTFSVSYGEIPFPTKLYGSRLYPAGKYEGVLITIGAGQGENWWCVLFPPLCFVDFGTGDVLEMDQEGDEQPTESEQSLFDSTEQESDLLLTEENDLAQQEVEVRFFLVDLFDKVKNLFV
ncbi:stage II sporulation protein R [Caldalkalibacillus uzonensis]|uniref:Stage II sporulation protein R n=1 Tax=Caldalkalibacillus uzonensis TaxID=353224 RepID=A0ABU0CSK5_9BACI|nr:stage II sporulation protein R [Caldalkalibacillus uzonensis]MDQ0339397.1 stage II sporulation protein R [Caldalkalibacillus uzonensis]